MMMMMMRYRLLSNSTEACLQLLPLGETLNFHSFLIATTLLPITTTTRRTRTRTRTRRCSLPSLSSSSSSSSSPPPPSSHRPWHLLSFHTSASPRGRYIPLTDVEKDSVTTDTEKCSVFEQLSSDDSENEVEGEKNVAAHLQKVEVEEYLVVNFYVLVDVEDPKMEVARHSSFMEGKDIHGRIYISSQGINAQYSGPREDVMIYAQWVKDDPRFSHLYVQVSPSPCGHAFPRLRLQYKPSLVQVDGGTLGLPITDPSSRAVPLSPQNWKQRLLQAENSKLFQNWNMPGKEDNGKSVERPVLLLDVRNGYEWDIGHFKGARRPPVECFKSTEFGLQYNEGKEDPLANVDKENTDVLMYCTGGIRCDVYSALLRKQGFKNLYSLQGGVARYLIEENGENWLGNLFVFDSRLAVPPSNYKSDLDSCLKVTSKDANDEFETGTTQVEFCRCSLCNGPLSSIRHRNCTNLDCNKLFLCCGECAQKMKGCCSFGCTSAPRQRPYLVDAQQYKRWHNYRKDDLLAKPQNYLGKRAKRRLRRLEQSQKAIN